VRHDADLEGHRISMQRQAEFEKRRARLRFPNVKLHSGPGGDHVPNKIGPRALDA
jgi:hypothetical protein